MNAVEGCMCRDKASEEADKTSKEPTSKKAFFTSSWEGGRGEKRGRRKRFPPLMEAGNSDKGRGILPWREKIGFFS
jgi:hypothetical protein